MKLGEVEVRTVQQAVSIFLDLAYGSTYKPRRTPDLSMGPDSDAETVLSLFQRETCEAVPGHPVVLDSLHGFATWVNEAALEQAGITAESEVPVGGEMRLAEDGQPNHAGAVGELSGAG